MPRVHEVKKARRPLPDHGIAVGDSYFWWAFRSGRGSYKVFSKTRPKPSQLTQSTFYSTLLSVQESQPAFSDISDVESWTEEARSELENLKDEIEGNLSNMPDSLQQGDTGQLMQERIDGLYELISGLENLDFEPEEVDEESIEAPEDPKELEEWDKDQAFEEAKQEKHDEKLQELVDEIDGLDWSFG